MRRAAAADWPSIFLPQTGFRPLASEPRRDERVIHVCLRVPGDPQTALADALRSLTTGGGQYAEVDWCADRPRAPAHLLALAMQLRATLVFAQIQTAGIFTAEDLRAVRAAAPGVVIVQWDGDRRFPPSHPERSWFAPLAQGCDASLVTCTSDALEWAALGVPGAGYLQIGVDQNLYRPTTPAPNVPAIVMLANHNGLKGYESRKEAARRLSAKGDFAVYGSGWEGAGFPVAARPHLAQSEEAGVYSACRAAISASIRNDLPRYTSDRLFRAMASGAVTLVERFPDCEGLGLKHLDNCLIWRTFDGEDPGPYARGLDNWGGLMGCIYDVMGAPPDGRGYLASDGWRDVSRIRAGARELALTHSWDARMHELAAILEAIRAQRVA